MCPAQQPDTLLEIYTDGASRGNPGPASYSFLFVQSGKIIHEESAYLGAATNNTAEYHGIIAALTKARDLTKDAVRVYSDSELVIRQINGEYRINKPHLAELRAEIAALEKQFSSVEFRNVPRENPFIRRCDELCSRTLDGHGL
jgi:ribonuclease HI